jgi:multidrug efflux system membrane fusion protein
MPSTKDVHSGKAPRLRWLWLPTFALVGISAYSLWPGRERRKIRRNFVGTHAQAAAGACSHTGGRGDMVREGDMLLEIDPWPYQVQLVQAEGQLIRDQATLENARIDLACYETLLKQNAIPEQQVATQKATVTRNEEIVKTDQGQIESAKLNITYCHIVAPVTGRIGLRLVDLGNIVHAADTNGLLVITQIQPISVIFTIAENQLPPVFKKVNTGQRLRVDAYDREMKARIARGFLSTLENQIDQTTGRLRLRATFDNGDRALFPNQFVNARLLVEERQGVTLAPAATIQRNS